MPIQCWSRRGATADGEQVRTDPKEFGDGVEPAKRVEDELSLIRIVKPFVEITKSEADTLW